jgi:hypothetical protein
MSRSFLAVVTALVAMGVATLGSSGSLSATPQDAPVSVVTADRGWCC